MQNRHNLIMGPSGSGKSYLVKKALFNGSFGRRVIILDIQGEYDAPEVTLAELTKLRDKRSFVVKYEADTDEEIDYFFRIILELGDVHIICEEVGDYAKNAHFRKVARKGRLKGIRLVCLTQTPPDIDRRVSSQMTCTILFRFDEPIYLKYIRERYGSETAEKVVNLEQYEHTILGDKTIYNEYYKP